MKKTIFVIIAIIITAMILSLAKDAIIKTGVEKGVEVITGLKLRFGSFKVGIINTLVDIRGMTLFNPSGYEDRIMADMPEIYVKYDLPAIIQGKVHLPEVRLNLREFVVVKNENGELNLNSLKVVQAQKGARRPGGGEAVKVPEIQIDSLELKIGRVVYKDYAKGGASSVQEFNINLDEKYSNIRDPYSLVSLIVVRSLTNTTVANLTGFNLQGLQGTVYDTLKTAKQLSQQAVTTAEETVKQTIQTTGTAAKKAEETVSKAAGVLTGILKSPFGSKEE